MAFRKENNLGQLNISKNVIASIAGEAAMECYGVVGMASINAFKDGIAQILQKGNYAKGIEIKQDNNELQVDIYLIIAFGIKISEVALEVQKKVAYVLESALDIKVSCVNVHVQDVKQV